MFKMLAEKKGRDNLWYYVEKLENFGEADVDMTIKWD